MTGYYIRNCRSFETHEILKTLMEQEYGTCSHHEFDGILHGPFTEFNNVVLYDGIIRPVYCDDDGLINYIKSVEDLKEIFISQDKVFLGAV